MTKQKSMAERFIEAMQNTGDIMLRYQFQKDMIKQNIFTDEELDRIADKVISRISITADATDAILKIKALSDALDELSKGGM